MNRGFVKGYFGGMITVVILCVILYLANTYIGPNFSDSIGKKTYKKVDNLKAYIDTFYLDETDEEAMENGIYKGLVNSLGDRYSRYYTKQEYEDMLESQSGVFCGIGVGVSQDTDTGVITIVTVYKNSPAEEAGIQDGDILYKVKGKEVTGINLDDVIAEIKGEEGTAVELTVYRKSSDTYLDKEVERRIVEIPTISYEMADKENKIGYIAIAQFDENTDEQFSKALEDLKSQGMESVIFDVRSNPGGLYETVCNMLDEILPEGTIVYTLNKNGEREDKTSDADCLEVPMAVLINEDSASASEIFAGAIQDYGVGEIIGTQSFGKGIVQSVFSLKDGSAIKLTISKYYTPNGVNIHGKGITPDLEVEQPEDDKTDVQLEKALEELRK